MLAIEILGKFNNLLVGHQQVELILVVEASEDEIRENNDIVERGELDFQCSPH
jgi:hypothetical protein